MRVTIYPQFSFLSTFLKNRGAQIVDTKPQVLHYFGRDKQEVREILRDLKPDLFISHDMSFIKDFKKQPMAYHPCITDVTFLSNKDIYTNSLELTRMYYRKIGMEKTLILDKSVTHSIKLIKFKGLDIFKKLCSGVQKFMQWD